MGAGSPAAGFHGPLGRKSRSSKTMWAPAASTVPSGIRNSRRSSAEPGSPRSLSHQPDRSTTPAVRFASSIASTNGGALRVSTSLTTTRPSGPSPARPGDPSTSELGRQFDGAA